MRDGCTQLKALEGSSVVDANEGRKVRGEAVMVTCEGAVVHVPKKGGAASAVFSGTADEDESAIEACAEPMLTVVDATPHVVGVITNGGGDTQIIVRGSGSDGVFRSFSGWAGHNGSGGQCQEPEGFQDCVQFHFLFSWVGLKTNSCVLGELIS
jgi:hypothetical protein